ncbi:MAG: hypothetical protein V4582_04315 [Pseudomonadota bacterium]
MRASALALCCAHCAAQTAPDWAAPRGGAANPGPGPSAPLEPRQRLAAIAREGAWDIYLSGYVHHGRGTYSAERIAQFNEKNAWGIGIGKTLRHAGGDEEALYAFGLNDSHYRAQWMLGYAYQKVRPLGGAGWEAGIGLTPQLMSRRDYFGGRPFPILLPVASLGRRGARLMLSYVPRLSKNRGSGDVLFFFARIELDARSGAE